MILAYWRVALLSLSNHNELDLKVQGGYSQNFLSQILKIFVTLEWIIEPIKHKK
jgi:hypothetical protein